MGEIYGLLVLRRKNGSVEPNILSKIVDEIIACKIVCAVRQICLVTYRDRT